jgi:hypothetical protein
MVGSLGGGDCDGDAPAVAVVGGGPGAGPVTHISPKIGIGHGPSDIVDPPLGIYLVGRELS